jgi:hypothetical protein
MAAIIDAWPARPEATQRGQTSARLLSPVPVLILKLAQSARADDGPAFQRAHEVARIDSSLLNIVCARQLRMIGKP